MLRQRMCCPFAPRGLLLVLALGVFLWMSAVRAADPPFRRFVSLLAPEQLNATGVTGGAVVADLDGSGYALDGDQFPPLNQPLNVDGVDFQLQRNAAGCDHLVAAGQTLVLPDGTQSLYLLGLRTLGDPRATVLFRGVDGAEVSVLVRLSDWCVPGDWGERPAVKMSRRVGPDGTFDTRPVYLWAVSLPVPPAVHQVSFPPDAELHVFALAADLLAEPLWVTPPYVESRARITPLRRPLPGAVPRRGEKHLGWVAHWSEDRGLERYADSGAQSMLMNLFCWGMRDEAEQLVDFRKAEDWLGYLYETGLSAAIIVDTSIHHSSTPWRSDITKASGENVCDQNGTPTPYSSPFSPHFRSMVDRYIEDITGWVSQHDPAHRVSTYVDGAEVFWPGVLDWGPMSAVPFRDWLIGRYTSLDAINLRWGASFETIEDVRAPAFYRNGSTDFSPSSFEYGTWHNAGWLHPPVQIEPRRRYRVAAEARVADAMDGRVAATLVWQAEGHDQQHDVVFATGVTGGLWRRLGRVVTSPAWATSVTLHLGLKGKGQVDWRSPELALEFQQDNLMPNPTFAVDGEGALIAWSENDWAGGAALGLARDEHDATVLHIAVAPTPYPYLYPAAAWHDFVMFSMESYARAMNHWAERLKACDPSRQVMHYCGFTLGLLSQWDDLTLTQMPDVFFANAPAADINGFQMCSANGDFHYATVLTDLIRKYDRPMVATDLQDFTHGVHVGFSAMNRTALAAIAHGLDGAYAYCWQASYPPAYNWFGNWPGADSARWMDNMVRLTDLLEGATLETPTAFLLPLLPYCDADPFGGKSDMFDTMGWYKMLQQAGACVDVWTPYEVVRAEGNPFVPYRLVVVPDCPNLPVAAVERLQSFAEQGGTVLFGGRPPRLDETGRELPHPLLPRDTTPSLLYRSETSRLLLSPASLAPDTAFAFAGYSALSGGPTLVGSDGLWPGVVRQVCGAGAFVWTGGMDGRAFLGPVRRYRVAGNTPPLYLPDGFERWPRPEGLSSLALVREVLRAEGGLPTVRLDPPDPTVEVSVWREADAWCAVLIHTGSGNHWGGNVVFPEGRTGTPEVFADFARADIPGTPERKPFPSSLLDLDVVPGLPTVDPGAGSRVALPPFQDSCIVRW